MRRLALLAGLALLTGCVSMEWRGSMVPHLEINGDDGREPKPVALNRGALRPTEPGWPQFRGPARDGVTPAQGVEPDWSSAPRARWRVPVGEGHSSVILSGQSVFTMEQDGEEELVTARSLDDGEILWKYGVRTRWGDFMSGVGPRSTPTLHAGRLYALFTDGSLVCLEADSGKLLWKTKIIQEGYEFPEWGLSCSPLVWKGLVIVTPGVKRSGPGLPFGFRETGLGLRLSWRRGLPVALHPQPAWKGSVGYGGLRKNRLSRAPFRKDELGGALENFSQQRPDCAAPCSSGKFLPPFRRVRKRLRGPGRFSRKRRTLPRKDGLEVEEPQEQVLQSRTEGWFRLRLQ